MKVLEKSTTQLSVEETDKQESNSNELTERIRVENTPFMAVRLDEEWFLTMGKYRLSSTYKSLDEMLEAEKVIGMNWDLLTGVIGLMVEILNNEKNG